MKPKYMHPGSYVEEVSYRGKAMQGFSTSITAFVGFFFRGPLNEPVRISSFTNFKEHFGGLHENSETSYAIQQFFLNGGQDTYIVRASDYQENRALALADEETGSGLYALESLPVPGFNLLCIPDVAGLPISAMQAVYAKAIEYCRRKKAFLIIDIPEFVNSPRLMLQWITENSGLRDENAAVYFPRVTISDDLSNSAPRNIASSGTIGGVYARIDTERGVWKAPAGIEADIRGAKPATSLTDRENELLNSQGINGLRIFPGKGHLVWGARTLKGSDYFASECKYIPVKRLSLFIQQSLYLGLRWTAFEKNDVLLWAQIRKDTEAFLHELFRKGAFQGNTPRKAYFLKCGQETMTQTEIDQGIINLIIGFAPVKPSEFILNTLQFKAR